MKRIGPLSGMRWLVLLLIFLTSYTADVPAQETDDAAIELNLLDFVPLAVGNRWTYKHFYMNYMHGAGGHFDSLRYPLGSLPDSLKVEERIVSIEITHTEVIDDLEYFVFSDADYAFPPLPEFFWGGKKVRLSAEGFLVFRWNGQDIPVYDFGHLGNPQEYTGTLPSGSGRAEVSFSRVYAQYRIPRIHFSLGYKDEAPFSCVGASSFLQGYGVGLAYIEALGFEADPIFRHGVTPISATISGEEIVYEKMRSLYESRSESTGLGQVGQLRMREGFDFSEGKNSEPSNDFNLVMRNPSTPLSFPGYLSFFPQLYSKTGVSHLGKIDFGLLISEGIPPDLRLDYHSAVPIREGHTYVARSREGGEALLYIFEDVRDVTPFGVVLRTFNHIKFDWVYYPDGLSDATTSVQPISWGQLKYLVPGRTSTSQDTPNRLEK